MRADLGIDFGGTSVRVAVAVEGSAPVVVTTDSSVPWLDGWDASLASLRAAIDDALQSSGVQKSSVRGVGAGFAGAGHQQIADGWRQALSEEFPVCDVVVISDRELVLPTLGVESGIAVIAGTGATAYRRSRTGETATADGWGPLFGDSGGAFFLGQSAIKCGLRAFDGRGPATELEDAMSRALGLTCIREAPEVARFGPRSIRRVAALAPEVIAVAQGGDEVAESIVSAGVGALAESVSAVRGTRAVSQPEIVALAGGVLVGSSHYRQRLIEALVPLGLTREGIRVVTEPVLGALALAWGYANQQGEYPMGPTRSSEI